MTEKSVRTRFKPGQSGNPAGRPKVVREIREMAREKAETAFAKVVKLLSSRDERVVMTAAQEILNRAYGKPTQYLDVTERREAVDLSDAELACIAAGGSFVSGSGGRAAAEANGAEEPDQIH